MDILVTYEGFSRLLILEQEDEEAYHKLEKCARELLPQSMRALGFRITYIRKGTRLVVLDNGDFVQATKEPLPAEQSSYEFTVVISERATEDGGDNEPQTLTGT